MKRSILAIVLCVAAWTGATVPSQARPARDTVSVALDWTPNTNHTGIYVAQKLGYYAAAGIDLKILPYASTAPETLVSHRKADFGFSYSAGVAFARAAGEDVTSVFAVLQHTALEIGVRADRNDIATPKDLDGKTYAGFGTPDEKPLLETVIRDAGGKGVFKDVTLNTSAYDAVYRGKADFTLPLATWEVIQARLAGKPLKTFKLARYGVPPEYSALIASSNAFLKADPALARRFLAATARGYQYAADHPRAAARHPDRRQQAGADAAEARVPERRPDGAELLQGRLRRGRHADARRLEGLRRIPLRTPRADRRRRQEADSPARLRVVLHERVHAAQELMRARSCSPCCRRS